MTDPLLKHCQILKAGDDLTAFLAIAKPLTPIQILQENTLTYLFLPKYHVLITPDDTKIKGVVFETGFPGTVRQISIGTTGDEAEKILGPTQRPWPMPHPDYVLLWDTPSFIRLDLDRKTEKVKAIYT